MLRSSVIITSATRTSVLLLQKADGTFRGICFLLFHASEARACESTEGTRIQEYSFSHIFRLAYQAVIEIWRKSA